MSRFEDTSLAKVIRFLTPIRKNGLELRQLMGWTIIWVLIIIAPAAIVLEARYGTDPPTNLFILLLIGFLFVCAVVIIAVHAARGYFFPTDSVLTRSERREIARRGRVKHGRKTS